MTIKDRLFKLENLNTGQDLMKLCPRKRKALNIRFKGDLPHLTPVPCSGGTLRYGFICLRKWRIRT